LEVYKTSTAIIRIANPKERVFAGIVRPEEFLMGVTWGELSYFGNYFFEFRFLS
jgi:hypothetical protein